MDEENEKPSEFQFGNLDQIMMLMIYGATNLIEKSWPVSRQAERIAAFNAEFMNFRVQHEEKHTTKHNDACPFCAALKLNAHLNRTENG